MSSDLIPVKNILDRMKAGELIRLDDPEYYIVQEIVDQTISLSAALNASTDVNQLRSS
jgi:hypothetical protein